MWHWFRWILFGIIILGVAIGIFMGYDRWKFNNTKNLNFFTSNPVDLEQIKSFSFFRSCMGHDNSGKNIDGVEETMRSMKHYVLPTEEYKGTIDKVKIFAPFDGKVVTVDHSEEDMGGFIGLSPKVAPHFTFEFGHVMPSKSLNVGSKVKSGELVGYAWIGPELTSFDLLLWTSADKNRTSPQGGLLDSFMHHLTDEVTQDYQNHGLNTENMIISKETRDGDPCKVDPTVPSKKSGVNEANFAQIPGDQGLMINVGHK